MLQRLTQMQTRFDNKRLALMVDHAWHAIGNIISCECSFYSAIRISDELLLFLLLRHRFIHLALLAFVVFPKASDHISFFLATVGASAILAALEARRFSYSCSHLSPLSPLRQR